MPVTAAAAVAIANDYDDHGNGGADDDGGGGGGGGGAECFEPFGDAGSEAIGAIHELGVRHVAKFMDKPRATAEWAAWGYHLHGR